MSVAETRAELLSTLAELGQIRPQWRLGQLMANLATTAGRLHSGAVWDLDDAEALAAARTLIEQYSDIESDDPVRPADQGRGPSVRSF